MTLLLVHTGGTIGMAPGPLGLEPAAGLVEQALTALLPDNVQLLTHIFDPLLDSADLSPSDWNRILDVIDAHPGIPVIVTHGTDTMSFSGAALAQALAGSGRHVVLCGSMVPLGQGGDAEANLALAVRAAQSPDATVELVFSGQRLAAAGLVKHDSRGHDAFRSQPQATLLPPRKRRFDDRRLAILTLSPGLPATVLVAALGGLDAAVLRVFGAGTVMSDPAILAALTDAVAQGKRIRAVSQCEAGGLEPGAYAAGAGLWQAGVENGGPETSEAALIHLWLNP
ncbi:asparaginase domain-containing protein [Pseudogemmobacter sp. W21_MBD1_M6]|uniref:asparaginase domain-containing protein n=1 Tax=Pseudogemmobacter sp. W21_MBD1_M6 TaxID=3240271 RepID=UPI003F9C64F4